MLFVEEDGKCTVESEVAARFRQHILKHPVETIGDEDVRVVLDHFRSQSNLMVQKSAQYSWLIESIDNAQFVNFYIRYVQLLCDTSNTDYLTRPANHVVCNFIRLQMIVWNVTDKLDTLCLKLAANELPFYLFQLLKLPQVRPSVCLVETNPRLVVHSSIGVLHNLLNHIPNIRATFRKAGGVRVLISYATATSANESRNLDNDAIIRYLSLHTAALLVLSFLVDEGENESLHADDSHIVYLLTALKDSLNCSGHLYSTRYGYQAQELLVGMQNLAGPDRNKKALIRNGAIECVRTAFEIAKEVKVPYTPKNAPNALISDSTNIDYLVEKALEFLWLLSFVPESHGFFTPGSSFRRLIDWFATDGIWSNGCRRAAQGILWSLPSTHALNTENTGQIGAMMAVERQQRRQHGHLMISYQHSTKNIMIKVRDHLMDLGYSVWMDVDYTRGSFVDAMAQAIEDAAGLIIGLSQAFKNSPHCRQEVKYAYNLGIPLFPLQLESDFNADGWLGLLVATIIYIPLTNESQVPEAVRQLQEQLGDIGHKSRAASNEAMEFSKILSNVFLTQSYPGFRARKASHGADKWCQGPTTSVPQSMEILMKDLPTAPVRLEPLPSNVEPSSPERPPITLTRSLPSQPFYSSSNGSPSLHNWHHNDVSLWLEQEGLIRFRHSLGTIDGRMLVELLRWRRVAPESLSISLYRDLGMTVIDQLRLFSALAKLSLRAT